MPTNDATLQKYNLRDVAEETEQFYWIRNKQKKSLCTNVDLKFIVAKDNVQMYHNFKYVSYYLELSWPHVVHVQLRRIELCVIVVKSKSSKIEMSADLL